MSQQNSIPHACLWTLTTHQQSLARERVAPCHPSHNKHSDNTRTYTGEEQESASHPLPSNGSQETCAGGIGHQHNKQNKLYSSHGRFEREIRCPTHRLSPRLVNSLAPSTSPLHARECPLNEPIFNSLHRNVSRLWPSKAILTTREPAPGEDLKHGAETSRKQS